MHFVQTDQRYIVSYSVKKGLIYLSADSVGLRLDCVYVPADLGLYCLHMANITFPGWSLSFTAFICIYSPIYSPILKHIKLKAVYSLVKFPILSLHSKYTDR